MFCLFKKNFFPKVTPGIFLLSKTDTVCRGSDKAQEIETLYKGPGPPQHNKHVVGALTGPALLVHQA